MEAVNSATYKLELLFLVFTNFLGVLLMAVLKKSPKEKFKLSLDSDRGALGVGEMIGLIRQLVGFLAFVIAFLGSLALLLDRQILWGILMMGLFLLSIGLAKLVILLK
jgi:hypothetical protein